jgi:hypothetical protein
MNGVGVCVFNVIDPWHAGRKFESIVEKPVTVVPASAPLLLPRAPAAGTGTSYPLCQVTFAGVVGLRNGGSVPIVEKLRSQLPLPSNVTWTDPLVAGGERGARGARHDGEQHGQGESAGRHRLGNVGRGPPRAQAEAPSSGLTRTSFGSPVP